MATKIGRNDPCHCGSGLKFKRCHGSIVNPESGSGNLSASATSMQLSRLGLPGQYQTIHLVNRFKEGDQRNALPFQGALGLYEVTFVLQRPGYSQSAENNISFTPLAGDSHLAIRSATSGGSVTEAESIYIAADLEHGSYRFTGLPNPKGFLGKLVSEPFHAKDRSHAEATAYGVISPALSHISLQLDIPLEIESRYVKDMTTGSIQVSLRTPSLQAPLNVAPLTDPNSDLLAFASLYREALSSSSPVYAFLCFYKLIEAIEGRRVRLEREAKRRKTIYECPKEVLPSNEADVKLWLDSIFTVRADWDLMGLQSAVPAKYRGKAVSQINAKVLNPVRRNIAHALFTGRSIGLTADDLLHTQSVTTLLPLTKCIARAMLRSDFPTEFLAHVPAYSPKCQ